MSEASTSTSATTSAWPNLLPTEDIQKWAKIDAEAPGALLAEIVNDAKHIRRMAWARLICAVVLFAGSLALSAYFMAAAGQVAYGSVTAGAGTLTVVTILLTGRVPTLRRK